ncbi:MAG: helicase HerA domain-containing protein [Candidatus Helarchaeota archaeon]
MERLRFSVTDIKNANKCPRLFVLNKRYKKKIWRYTGVVVGSLVHNTIDKFIHQVKTSPSFQTTLQQQRSPTDLLKKIQQALYALYLEQVMTYKEKIRPSADLTIYCRSYNRGWHLLQRAAELIRDIFYPAFSTMPIKEAITKVFLATEWSFQLDLDIEQHPFKLTGRIDWISHDINTNRVLVWDFKTSDSDYYYQDFIQIALYTFAIKKKMFLEAEPALVYFAEDKVDLLEFDKEKITRIIPLFHAILLKMRRWYLEEEIPPQTVDRIFCGKCILQKDCLRKYGAVTNNISTMDQKGHIVPRQPLTHPDTSPKSSLPMHLTTPERLLSDKNSKTSPPSHQSTSSPQASLARIGTDPAQKAVTIPLPNLLRHAAIIGSTGSGKTVLGKVLIEEALIHNYSALIIDPQGDLSSLILPKDTKWAELLTKIHVKIFTPGSEKGIKLALDPLQSPAPIHLSNREYLYMLLDNVASLLLMIMGYSFRKTTPNEKAILESLIYQFWYNKKVLNFITLATAVKSAQSIKSLVDDREIAIDSLITTSKRKDLVHNLMKLGAGTEGYFFLGGEPLNISKMIQNGPNLYIINLAGAGTDISKRQLVISWILRQVYDWMLQNPQLSQDHIRFLLYFDEIADFLPPHPHDPPSKKMLTRLLRQARKYGIACILATQSPATIDYKALDNVSSFFIGKIPSEQSYRKILALATPYLASASPTTASILAKIRTVPPGTFLQFGIKQPPKLIHVRMPYSQHQTLSLDQIRQITHSKPS